MADGDGISAERYLFVTIAERPAQLKPTALQEKSSEETRQRDEKEQKQTLAVSSKAVSPQAAAERQDQGCRDRDTSDKRTARILQHHEAGVSKRHVVTPRYLGVQRDDRDSDRAQCRDEAPDDKLESPRPHHVIDYRVVRVLGMVLHLGFGSGGGVGL